jgi:hypothetical protein
MKLVMSTFETFSTSDRKELSEMGPRCKSRDVPSLRQTYVGLILGVRCYGPGQRHAV